MIVVRILQVIWDGQSTEDGQASVPHVEHWADWLCEADVECVQVQGTNSVVERQRSQIVIQQHPETPQVR